MPEITKPKVYFTHQITPEALVKIYEQLGAPLDGRKVAVKVSTGEAGNNNYLSPALIKDLVQKVQGTIVECNTAYEGARNNTAAHLQAAQEHGFTAIAPIDIMDADGETEIPVHGRHLDVDIIGQNLDHYDAMINLAHFKGHQMGGFGGVLKNQAIGIASAVGKVYIHTAGKSRDLAKFFRCFDTPESMAEMLPPQDDFLESMAEAAKAVADHFAREGKPVLYISIINNLSIDCDCAAEPEAPCMADIGIAASLDPVALDQACIDLIWNSNDPGRDHFVERVEQQNGRHILEAAANLGLGSRNYELVNLG